MIQKSRRKQISKKIAVQRMRKLLFGILLFCVFWGARDLETRKAMAAGATVSIDTRKNKVVEGDTVYVVITVSSTNAIKGFEGYFSYDNRVLQFVTGGSVVHGNDDEFQVSDMERSSSATKIKYSVKFYARKKGHTTIALKQPYHVVEDNDSETKMSVSYSPLDVVVVKAEDEIKKNSATAVPKSSGQPKKNTNEQDKKEPEASKKPKEKETPSPSASAKPKENSKQESKGVGINEMIELQKPEDESSVPPGFLETEIEINEEKITAYVLKGNEEKGFVLLYGKAKNQKNEEQQEAKFYVYDRDDQTLMPYEHIKALYRSMNEKDLVGDTSQKTIQSLKYVIGIMGVFCALMLLLAIAFRIRYSYKD